MSIRPLGVAAWEEAEKTKLWAPTGKGDVELQVFWGRDHSGSFPLTRAEALHLYHQLGDWLMSHPQEKP
jgi:hypothetical protein